MSKRVPTPPGGHFIGAAACTAIVAGLVGIFAGLLRLAASNGPEDDIDRAMETSNGNWGLAIAVALAVLAVVLWMMGRRRRREVDSNTLSSLGPPPPAPR